MSESTVTAFPGAQISSDRRAHFLNYVAGAFDAYVKLHGEEPDAIVSVMGGLKQDARCSWTIGGASEGGATTMLAFAQAVLTRELCNPNGPGGAA